MNGIPTIAEDARYYFDEIAAQRPVTFIETYCRHYEGARFAGKPFTLLDWQKQIIRTLFGWKHRISGLRRFRELYLLTAKGAGKTPMLAGIALYMLLADGEPGAHVVSMASSFEQANLTFDAGKKYIAQDKKLSRNCDVTQYRIDGPKFSKWTTISGQPNGRSGPRPSCVLADECHEWPAGTDKTYGMLTANLFKRAQPLLLVATNAGETLTSFAGELHERACKVRDGTEDDPTLLPVIFEADAKLDWRSEEAAAAANPSLGSFIGFDQLKPEQSKGEPRYRRLYLSQWIQGSRKWLDLDQWDKCVRPIDPSAIKTAPLYIGVDLSQGDDLCAVDLVWPTPDKIYVRSHFWLPQCTAERYETTNSIPYLKWAEAGYMTLTKGPTIGPAERRQIADYIVAASKAHKVKAVCYDRARADEAIAILEAAELVCVPIPQGWSLSPGCSELERRLKEEAISIEPNPVLRMNAEIVEVKEDGRGNFWPVKPGAKGRYAGGRSQKIDGITALVTALVEARKHSFPRAQMNFKGRVVSI